MLLRIEGKVEIGLGKAHFGPGSRSHLFMELGWTFYLPPSSHHHKRIWPTHTLQRTFWVNPGLAFIGP